jgi:hypothetical protein
MLVVARNAERVRVPVAVAATCPPPVACAWRMMAAVANARHKAVPVRVRVPVEPVDQTLEPVRVRAADATDDPTALAERLTAPVAVEPPFKAVP